MKRLYIIILAIFMAAPAFQPYAEAQKPRKERAAKKRVVKKRRTTRRVRRKVSQRAHIRYASLPRYGVRVKTLPVGTVVMKRSNAVFHYHNGIFYSSVGTEFVVVKPAMGVRVGTLPVSHIKVIVPRGSFYYYYYGTFYLKEGNEFEVVGAPEGAVVNAIPEGYEIKEVNGIEYYVLNGTYFREVDAEEFEGGEGYEVVSI